MGALVDMLLTDYFVYIHIPRTGGNWAREILKSSKKEWNTRSRVGHPGYVDVPEPFRDKPAFAFVRHPWDWYVSWYEYIVGRIKRGDVDDGERHWQGIVGRPIHGPEAFQESFDRQMEFHRDGGLSLMIQRLTRDEHDQLRVKLYRYESLRADWIGALEEAGAPISAHLRNSILHSRPYNGSLRQPFVHYYTPEMRDRVREKEAWVIERFGYEYPTT